MARDSSARKKRRSAYAVLFVAVNDLQINQNPKNVISEQVSPAESVLGDRYITQSEADS